MVKYFFPHGSGPWILECALYEGSLNNLLLWPSHLLDPDRVKNLWDILDRHNRQHSLPLSSKPQLREYLLEEWCSSLEYNSSVESVHTLGTKVFSAVWCFLLFGALWYSLQSLLSSDQFVLSAALTSVDTPSCYQMSYYVSFCTVFFPLLSLTPRFLQIPSACTT